MSYHEFCIQVAPMIKEMQEECKKMTQEEFLAFRQEIMESVAVKKEISKRFMTAVLDLIQKNIFQKDRGMA